MVGYYHFIVPARSDATVYGSIVIDWFYSLISDSFVENKTIINSRPDWAHGGQSYEEVFIKGMTFKYKNTEFVISASKESSDDDVWIYVYARDNRTWNYDRTLRIEHNDSYSQTFSYLIGQNSDYFIIACSEYSYCYYLVIKVDRPVNPRDTDLYVSILSSNEGSYNKSFDNEDIINTPARFALGTDINYDDDYLLNYYNKKTELNNVYVYTRNYGVRGKISNLISLTRWREAKIGTFHLINGIQYVGLYHLNYLISGYYGILLRVY